MDFQYIHLLTDYLNANPNVSFFITFMIAFTESLAIIGSVIPGSVTMTAIGALIGSGIVPMGPTLSFAILGAFAGDFLSYWVGKRYNNRLRSIWPLNKNPKWLVLGEQFFEKHGGKSVVFGRFFGPVRSAVPLIAGMMKMKTARFLVAALPSAMFWSLIYIFPGILVGALSLQLPKAAATKFILMVLVLVAFGWLIFLAIHIMFKRGVLVIDRFMEYAWSKVFSSPRFTLFTDFFNHPQQVNPHYQLARVVGILLCLMLFAWLFISVYFDGILAALNEPVVTLMRSLRLPKAENVMIAITFMGDKKILLSVTFLFGLWLLWRRCFYLAFIWFFVIFGGAASAYFFKHIYFSPRPEGLLNGPDSSSFPSGHATVATLVYGFMAFLMACCVQQSRRSLVYGVAIIIILFVALSRLYLGVHWLTDVLAAMCLGVAFVLMGAVLYLRRLTKAPNLKSMLTMFLGLFFLIGVPYSALHFKKAQSDYALYWPKVSMGEDEWWDRPVRNQNIPLFVASRLGKIKEVLNVQWSGELNDITAHLIKNGWTLHSVDLSISNTLQRLSVRSRDLHLPILPALYHNALPEALFTYRNGDEQQITLMLWASFTTVEDDAENFWLGSVFTYLPKKQMEAASNQEVDQLYETAIETLKKSLGESFEHKVIQVPSDAQPIIMQSIYWNGELLLIKK